MSTHETLGERIRNQREKKGLTQAQLADALGLADGSRTTIVKWENGKQYPSSKKIPDLCKVLGCDAGYLFGEYETETREKSDIAEATGLSYDAAALLLQFKRTGDIITNRKKRLIQDLLSFRELGFLALVYEEYLDALSKYNARNYGYKIHKEECENVEISKEEYYELLEGKLRDAELKLVLQLTACIRDAHRK